MSKRILPNVGKYAILSIWETIEPKAALPLFFIGGCANALQTKERRAIAMYVTYQDLLLFCTFIVALISLIYQILRDKRK